MSRVNRQLEVDRGRMVGASSETEYGLCSSNLVDRRGKQCTQKTGVVTDEYEQEIAEGKW